METVISLTSRFPRPGRLDWIGLRPDRRAPMNIVQDAALNEKGLIGDHYAGQGKRAVSLIQAEHLPVIAALAARPDLVPEMLRRNLVISGLNLVAARKKRLQIGTVILRITGPCAPCSRMEETLGPGGYNAMRGHGGWTAEVITPGTFSLGDLVTVLADAP